jgi:hypothetical protein
LAVLLASAAAFAFPTSAIAAPVGCATTGASDVAQGSSPQDALLKEALDFVAGEGGEPAKQQLQEELEKAGGEVIIQLADLAGAAFGVPAVGSIVGSYVDLFSGMFGGGGGDPLAQAVAQLNKRTSCLEAHSQELTRALGSLANEVKTNENNQRVDKLAENQTDLIGFQLDALQFSNLGSDGRQALITGIVNLSNQLLPVSGTNVWAWRDIKVKRTDFGPLVELNPAKPALELAIEPYLMDLAFLAALRKSAGNLGPHEESVRKHIAFLIGTRGEAEAKGLPYSLADQFFRVTCGWDYKGTGGSASSVELLVNCRQANNAANSKQESLGIVALPASSSYYPEEQLKSQYGPQIDDAMRSLTYQVLADAGPMAKATLAAARALGAQFPTGPSKVANNDNRFDGNMTPVAQKTLYAVDTAGRMHMFNHIVHKVDTWKKDTAQIDDPKVLGTKVQDLPVIAVDDGVVRSPAGPNSREAIKVVENASISSVFGSGPTVDPRSQIQVIENAPSPLLRYELRNNLGEQNGIPGDWAAFVDVMPGQASSEGQIVYAARGDGALIWRRLSTPVLEATIPARPPSGALRNVFSGGEGVLYGVNGVGELVWHRDSRILSGFSEGSEWQERPVGIGWGDFTRLFSGGKGVIYAVKPDGTLWWYKHNGYLTGASHTQPGAWSEGKQIGTGWGGFTKLIAAPEGYIYAVNPQGELLFSGITAGKLARPSGKGQSNLPTDGTSSALFSRQWAVRRRMARLRF